MASSWFKPTPDSLWMRQQSKGKMRYASLFHLVWTVYVFGDLLFRNDALGKYWVLATSITFPIFLTLFILGQTRSMRYMECWGSCMAVLGLATMNFNASGGACYIIFACSYMGVNGSMRLGLMRMGIIIGIFLLTAQFAFHWPISVMFALAFIAFSVGTVNMIYRFNSQRDAELKLSHDEVRRLAAMAERERIGRDLHDLLGHSLSLIALKLELSRRLMDRDSVSARHEMEEAERVARHALAEVRSAVTGIRATGIAAELASARLLLSASMVNFDYVSDVPALPERVEATLALVLREAVTNIHRHAHATAAEARVEVKGNVLTLCISDNGKGGAGAEGNGLCGMRERVKALGGTLSFESSRGQGTRVRVSLPLTAADRLLAPGTPLASASSLAASLPLASATHRIIGAASASAEDGDNRLAS